jgi:hypothetical protein
MAWWARLLLIALWVALSAVVISVRATFIAE